MWNYLFKQTGNARQTCVTGKDKGAPHEGVDRDGAGVELLFFYKRKDKNRSCLVQKQTPSSSTQPHTHDTVPANKTTICCQQCAQIGGVRVEARSGFRTRLAQREGGGGEHLVPAGTLSVLPALVSSLSLEVGGVPIMPHNIPVNSLIYH